ncbi:MAG: hypothetical protein ABIK49_03840 [candidate division WOR-3 bacterium]
MMQIAFLFAIFAAGLCSGWAQENYFVKSYGGRGDQTGLLVVPRDTGFYIAGFMESVPGFGAAFIIRTDDFGETLWTRMIVDSGVTIVLNGAIGDGNGGCVMVGQRRTIRGDWDMLVIRVDSSGAMLWQKTSGTTSDDVATAVCDANDGWVVVGNTLRSGGYDIRLVKLDYEGNELWSRVMGSLQPDLAYAVARTGDAGFVIAGATYPAGSRFSNVLLFKVNYWGELVWWRQYGDWSWDEARAILATAEFGFTIAGFSSSYGADMDFYLLRTDSLGELVWFQTFAIPGLQKAYGLTQIPEGFVLVGEGFLPGEEAQLLLLRTDTAGNFVWQRFYGGDGYDCGVMAACLDDGGFAITGRTWVDSVNRYDIYLIRTDSSGRIGLNEIGNGVNRGEEIVAFPNPFRNRVWLQANCNKWAEVFSANGAYVRRINLDSEWDGRDESGKIVPPGVYIISTRGNSRRLKLIKCE